MNNISTSGGCTTPPIYTFLKGLSIKIIFGNILWEGAGLKSLD